MVWLTSVPATADGFRGEVAEVDGRADERTPTSPTPTCCARPRRRRPRRVRAAVRPAPRPALGGRRCARWATGRTPPTGCRTAWSRRTDGPGTFRGDAAVTTWLHRVVVNACLDRLRAAKVRRAEALPDDLEEHGDRGSLRSADRRDRRPGRPRRPDRAARAGPRRAAHPARGAARRARARRHGGLPGRRGRRRSSTAPSAP